jgi:hypothetical protein
MASHNLAGWLAYAGLRVFRPVDLFSCSRLHIWTRLSSSLHWTPRRSDARNTADSPLRKKKFPIAHHGWSQI